jgi:hypothetical protein
VGGGSFKLPSNWDGVKASAPCRCSGRAHCGQPADYEHQPEDTSIVARALRLWFHSAVRLAADGGGAVVGRNGWLF